MIPLMLPTIHPIDQSFHDAVSFLGLPSSDYAPTVGTGMTVVVRIRPKMISLGGQKVRLQFRGPSNLQTEGTVITAAYIGYASTASTRDAWDFNSTGGTQVFFDGAAGTTLLPRSSVMSDIVNFELHTLATVLVAFQITSGALRRFASEPGSQEVVSYHLSNTLEAGTTNKTTGYVAAADVSLALSRIRVAKGRDEFDG